MKQRFFSNNKIYVCRDAFLIEELQELSITLEKAEEPCSCEGGYSGLDGYQCEEARITLNKFLDSMVEEERHGTDATI